MYLQACLVFDIDTDTGLLSVEFVSENYTVGCTPWWGRGTPLIESGVSLSFMSGCAQGYPGACDRGPQVGHAQKDVIGFFELIIVGCENYAISSRLALTPQHTSESSLRWASILILPQPFRPYTSVSAWLSLLHVCVVPPTPN